MKFWKRLFALALCLTLLCAVLPQISLTVDAVTYTELGTIPKVQATANITEPTLGGNRLSTIPKFSVTDPTGKNVELGMTVWTKKNGIGMGKLLQ